MRIVAGSAGGIPLVVPKGVDLRPTMDRVRAAIFSSLAESVPGARVLDLFAGTGALGIEALSRGAARAVLVEQDRRAVTAIRQNLEKCGVAAEVFELDVFSYLDRLAPAQGFDLVLVDPPYAKRPGERDFTPELLRAEGLRKTLVPGGLLVLEHLPGAALPLGPHWECLRQKRYGATEVAFLRALSGPAEQEVS
jgi:16S rRNA (guanine966-N2)-methyltransferase